jgi:hypothetical protein
MANVDRPEGFKPFGPVLRASKYIAGATVYPGDLVHLEDDGKVDPATTGEAVLGVALSKAADGEELIVSDHPDQRYIVQADDGGTTDVTAQTAVGLNYPIVATSGSSAYNISRMELDGSESGTTATLPLRLLGLLDEPGNAWGNFAKVIVRINHNQLTNVGTGADGL